MTRLAIKNRPQFRFNGTDINRPAPHYTATLIPLIQESYADSELYLLLGGDSLASFDSWYRPNNILEACLLGVLNRPGYEVDLTRLQASGLKIEGRIQWIDGPAIFLSSTYVRDAIRRGEKVSTLVPDQVLEYITEHGLYT